MGRAGGRVGVGIAVGGIVAVGVDDGVCEGKGASVGNGVSEGVGSVGVERRAGVVAGNAVGWETQAAKNNGKVAAKAGKRFRLMDSTPGRVDSNSLSWKCQALQGYPEHPTLLKAQWVTLSNAGCHLVTTEPKCAGRHD